MATKGRIAGIETHIYDSLVKEAAYDGEGTHNAQIHFESGRDPQRPTSPCLVVGVDECLIYKVRLYDARDAYDDSYEEQAANGDSLFERKLQRPDNWHR